MDSTIRPDVRQVAVCKAAQCGVSEAVLTALGYHIEHRPTPMLMVLPTATVANDFSKDRLQDMILSTPALRRLVSDKRLPARDERPESTLTLKMFPGGFLALGGSNSPNTFARWAVRIVVADDCDRFPTSLGAEGDPGRLLVNRTTSYPDALAIFVSTPVEATGRISRLYELTDRRRWHVRCPACARWDWLTWSDRTHVWVEFTDRNPATAHLACPCGHVTFESERRALIATGAWRSTAEPIIRGHVGFHLPAMVSPFVTLESLAAKFLTARREGPHRMREFVTTMLAEGWRDPAQRVDPDDIVLEDF